MNAGAIVVHIATRLGLVPLGREKEWARLLVPTRDLRECPAILVGARLLGPEGAEELTQRLARVTEAERVLGRLEESGALGAEEAMELRFKYLERVVTGDVDVEDFLREEWVGGGRASAPGGAERTRMIPGGAPADPSIVLPRAGVKGGEETLLEMPPGPRPPASANPSIILPAGGAEDTMLGMGSAAPGAPTPGGTPVPLKLRPCPPDETPATVLSHGAAYALEVPEVQQGTWFGRYQVETELGRGGQGVVYKATDRELGRTVALKVIGSEEDGESVSRFIREARHVAKLKHPNIVGLHDIGTHEGRHYFSMDYVEGKSLTKVVLEGKLPLRSLVQILRDVCRAMAYAHGQGILHRDIKPENILIDGNLQGYLLDFGLAKEVRGGAASGLSVTGNVFGTPQYMSPEQARGHHREVDPRSDVYSIGATLYFVLTKTPPFVGANPLVVLEKVTSQDPVPPSRIAPTIDAELETICLHAMEKARPRRYQSAQEIAEDLDLYLRGEPIRARPTPFLSRFWRKKRNRVAVAVAVPSLALALLLGYLGFDFVRREVTYRDILRQGDDALGRRDLVAALEAYERAFVVHPGSREVQERREAAVRIKVRELLSGAQAALLTGDFDLAQSLGDQAVALDPRSADAVAVRDQAVRRRNRKAVEEHTARLLRDAERSMVTDVAREQFQKDLKDAIQASVEAQQLDPEGAGKAAYLRGRAFHLLGNFNRALEAYEEALKADPVHEQALLYSGTLHLARAWMASTLPERLEWEERRVAELTGKAAEALERLEKIGFSKLPPDQLDRAEIFLRAARGAPQDALDWAERKYSEEDAPWYVLRARGMILAQLGVAAEALPLLDRALAKQKGDFLAHLTRANLLFAGSPDEALQAYQASIEANAACAEAHYGKGCAWAVLRKPQAADASFSEALALDPAFAPALLARARLRRSEGRAPEAIEDLEAYLSIRRDPAALLLSAELRRVTHDLDGAVKDLDEYLALRPGDPGGRVVHGSIRVEQHRFEEALADFKAVLERHPGHAEALWHRAAALEAAGRPDEAAADLAEILRLDPSRADVRLRKGALHETQAQWPAAEACYTELIDRDRQNAEAWIARGWSRVRSGRPEDALPDFDQAVLLSPAATRAYLGRGLAHLAMRNLDRATAEFDAAIATNPARAEGYYHRGLVRLARERYADAFADFNRAIEDRSLARLRFHRGLALHGLGRFDDAAADLALAEQAAPMDPDVPLARALALQAKRDLAGAQASITRALELAPENDRALLIRSELLRATGAPEKALEDLDAVLKRNPGFVPALVARAHLESGLGRHDAAARDVEEAFRREPANVAVLMARADVLAQKGDLPAAVAAYDEVVKAAPRTVAAYVNRGLAHYRAGNAVAAVRDYSTALRVDPNSVAALVNRGVALNSMKEYDPAIADFTAALRKDPRATAAHLNRGLAHLRKGDGRAAVADFTQALQIQPGLPEALLNRGLARSTLGELDAALADFARALEARPGYAAAHVNRSAVFLAQEKLEAALTEATHAISIEAMNPEAYVSRARIHLRRGTYDLALGDVQKSVALSPDSPEAHLVAGQVFDGLADPIRALGHYNRAVDLAPADGASRYHRGLLHLKARRFVDAREDLQQAARLSRTLEQTVRRALDECEKGLRGGSR